MDATSTRKIGKYEITGVLGRGGMGVVYRAEDKRIGRPVAIKTLTEGFSGQPEMLERFYREAQAGILQHPNIVIIYDLGDEDGVPFIVMEHVNGEPLDKIIASGRQLPLLDKLSIIEQVCAALGYAHQRGVVHRDIKPANVIVQPDGHAKIVDFGIARIQKTAAETELTRTGSVIGTIHYIAPERLKGQPFDGRSDIFSTGIMLYQLLTGQLPFTGENMTVLHNLVNEPHRPLSAFLQNYPPALDGIIDRALAKDPERRYATAEELAADLHALSENLKKDRVSELFNDAERLTAEQQFGRAREVLLQLVRIDAQHTAARQLLAIVQQHLVTQEQERRHRLLEQLQSEIESCLKNNNYERATEMVNRAVEQLPSEPALLQLKARVATQTRAFQARRLIESTVASAQAAFVDSPGEALLIVQKALQELPGEERLLSLEDSLRQRLKIAEKEQVRARYLREAQAAIDRSQFEKAIEVLESYQLEFADAAGVNELLDFAKGELARQKRRTRIAECASQARWLLREQRFEEAIRLLEPAAAETGDLSLARLLADARAQHGATRQSEAEATPAQKVTASEGAVTGAPPEAVVSQLPLAGRPRRSAIPVVIVAGLVVVLAAAGAAWWFHRRPAAGHQPQVPVISRAADVSAPATAPATPPADTPAYLAVHSAPGALISVDNAPQGKADDGGDLTVQVKPGTGTLQVSLDGYEPASQTFTVKPGDKSSIAVPLNPVAPPPKSESAVVPAAAPVRILSFTAEDSQIEQGQSTALHWQTANAANVSIDNGIARVPASGETTVQPAVTTTYILTAKGNGSVLQKSVSVIVKPKVNEPPPPVVKTPQAADQSALLLAVINRFEAAYNAHNLAAMQAVWTGLKAQQLLGLQSFFRGNPGARVADECPLAALTVSAETASWTCTETTTLLVGGKPMSHSQSIRFSFARANGAWTIENRR